MYCMLICKKPFCFSTLHFGLLSMPVLFFTKQYVCVQYGREYIISANNLNFSEALSKIKSTNKIYSFHSTNCKVPVYTLQILKIFKKGIIIFCKCV